MTVTSMQRALIHLEVMTAFAMQVSPEMEDLVMVCHLYTTIQSLSVIHDL